MKHLTIDEIIEIQDRCHSIELSRSANLDHYKENKLTVTLQYKSITVNLDEYLLSEQEYIARQQHLTTKKKESIEYLPAYRRAIARNASFAMKIFKEKKEIFRTRKNYLTDEGIMTQMLDYEKLFAQWEKEHGKYKYEEDMTSEEQEELYNMRHYGPGSLWAQGEAILARIE